MNKSQTIAVFGLGSMGFGVAGSILRAQHQVIGYDVKDAQLQAFTQLGGSSGGHPGNALNDAAKFDIAVVVVLNAEQVESVLFGEHGIVQHMRPGTCVIVCATVAPQFARDAAVRCENCNVLYLDAPISGGALKAAAGQLSVMAAGSPQAFAASQPALEAMAETVFELGPEAGAGSAMKAVNQLLAGVHIATMAEAITFGMTQGLTPANLVDVISQCAGTSWMFENRAPHVVDGDYTPHSAINIWPKDLGIVLDIAKSANFSAPMTATALQQFIAAAGSGLGTEDDAAIAKVYARNAGITLP